MTKRRVRTWLGQGTDLQSRQRRIAVLHRSDRIDPVWLTIVGGAVFTLLALVGTLAWFVKDVAPQEGMILDRRIVGSVTEPGPCLQDLALGSDGQLHLSVSRALNCASPQLSGGVVAYNPIWQTWGDEVLPFAQDAGVTVPETLTRNGSSLWLGGNQDGVATAGPDGRWRVWLSQTLFDGAGGPFSSADVASAASSPDGDRTLFITKSGQSGMYTLPEARWKPAFPSRLTKMVHRAVLAENGVWLAAETEVLFATARGGGGPAFDAPRTAVSGKAISLVPDPQGGVLALVQVDCAQRVASTCNRILRLTSSSTGLSSQVLLDGASSMHDSDPARIRFLAPLTSSLLFAGSTGASVYDTAARQWRDVIRRKVTALVPINADQVAFGGQDWIGLVSENGTSVRTAAVPASEGPVTQILVSQAERPIYVTESGSLFQLSADGAALPLFRPTAPRAAEPTRFVYALRDYLVLATENSVWLRADANRSYLKIGDDRIADLLAEAREVATADGKLVTFTPGSATMGILAVINPAAKPPVSVIEVPTLTAIAPSVRGERAVAVTEAGDLLEIDLQGKPRILSQMAKPLEGIKNTSAITDVDVIGGDVLIASDLGIERHDPTLSATLRVDRTPTTSLAADERSGEIYQVTKDGELRAFRVASATDPASTRLLIGGPRFVFDQAELLDMRILSPERAVFLGRSDGRSLTLQVYNAKQRRIEADVRFSVPADVNRASIVDFRTNADFLVLADGQLFGARGPVPKAPRSSETVTGWLSSDGVVAVERDATTDLLFLHQIKGDAHSCRFRGSALPGTRILWSQPIASGVTFAVHDKGYAVHDEKQDRWFPVPLPEDDYSVAVAFDALWLRGAGGASPNLFELRLDSVPRPPSCEAESPNLVPVLHEKGVIDPKTGTLMTLAKDGSIKIAERGSGEVRTHRPGIGAVPKGTIKRALMTGQGIWALASEGLYLYDMTQRRWQRTLAWTASNDWSAWSLMLGEGRLAGQVVAALQSELAYDIITAPIDGTATGTRRQFQVPPPLRVETDGSLVPLAFWTSPAPQVDVLHFDGLLVFIDLRDNREIGRWDGIPDGTALPAVVGGRLVVFLEASRAILVASAPGRDGLTGQPRQHAWPEGRTVGFDDDGVPMVQLGNGSIVRCSAGRPCEALTTDVERFDTDTITAARRLGIYWLVTRADGMGEVLVPAERGGLKVAARVPDAQKLFAGASPGVRLSADANALIIQRDDGSAAFRFPAASSTLRSMIEGVSNGKYLAVNVDDSVALTPSGSLKTWWSAELVPETAEPWRTASAVGRLDRSFWRQNEGTLTLSAVGCSIGSRIGDPGRRAAVCAEEWEIPAPDGDVLWLRKSATVLVAGLADGRKASIQLESGKPEGSWRHTTPEVQDAASELSAFQQRLFTTPDGSLSLTRPARFVLVPESVSVGRGQLTVSGTVRGKTAEPLSEFLLPWVKSDNGEKRFSVTGPAGAFDFSYADAWVEGFFLPSVLRWPAVQADGSILALSPLGLLRFSDAPELRNASGTLQRFPPAADSSAIATNGGYWFDDAFFAAREGAAAPSAISSQQLGDLTIEQDFRAQGVSVTYSGVQALSEAGFRWDEVQGLAFGPQSEPIAFSPVGPVPLLGDLVGEAQVTPQWYAGSDLNGLRSNWPQQPPDPGFALVNVGGQWLLPDDHLVAAHGSAGEGWLVLPARVEQILDSLAPAASFGISVEAWEPLGVGDGRVFQAQDQLYLAQGGKIRQIGRDELAELRERAQRLGPLSVRKADGRTSFGLALTSGTMDVPIAEGRFAFDRIASVRLGPDGSLVLLADQVLQVPSGPTPELAEMSFLGPIGQGERLSASADRARVVLQDPVSNNDECIPFGPPYLERCGSLANKPDQRRLAFGDGLILEATKGVDWTFRLLAKERDWGTVSYRDGLFSHQRYSEVAHCAEALYLIDLDGRLWRRSASEGPTSHQPILAGATGVSLHCMLEGRQERTSASLLVRDTDGKWSALDLDPEGAATLRPISPQLAFVQELLDGPSGADGQRLARKNDSQAVGFTADGRLFETLRPDQADEQILEPLAGGPGPARSLDLPDGYVLVGSDLWAVAEQTMVYFGNLANADELFPRPMERGIAVLPNACAIRAQRAESTDSTIVACKGGTNLRVVATTSGLSVTRFDGAAPTETLEEINRLRAGVDIDSGLREVSLLGASVDLATFDGRFSFDRITAISTTPSGSLHLLAADGWYRSETARLDMSDAATRESLSVAIALRSRFPVMTQTASMALWPDLDGVCLGVESAETVVRLREPITRASRPQVETTCVDILSRDRLRLYWQDEDGEFISVLNGSLVVDPLVKGRFLSDASDMRQAIRSGSSSTEDTTFCIASRLPGVWIAGDGMSASARVDAAACGPARPEPPVEVDGKRFELRSNWLFFRNLAE